jgi:hypothetical protein
MPRKSALATLALALSLVGPIIGGCGRSQAPLARKPAPGDPSFTLGAGDSIGTELFAPRMTQGMAARGQSSAVADIRD